MPKSGSFGFAKRWLVCRAKPNVPFVRLAKIVFKKVRWQKNKKHKGRLVCRITRCPVVIWSVCFGLPVKMVCLCFMFKLWSVSRLWNGRPTIGYNGFGLGEGGDFHHKC